MKTPTNPAVQAAKDEARALHKATSPVQQAHFALGGTFTRTGTLRGGTRASRDAVRAADAAWRAAERRLTLLELALARGETR